MDVIFFPIKLGAEVIPPDPSLTTRSVSSIRSSTRPFHPGADPATRLWL